MVWNPYVHWLFTFILVKIVQVLAVFFGRLIKIIKLINCLFFTYLFCWLFVDKLLVLLFKCKFSEWPADFSCIMGDLHEKRWRFYSFFLWLTPAEEGSQARSHKITLTEFIRLTLDDEHSIFRISFFRLSVSR